MTKVLEMQRLLRKYREETGEHEADMRKVAEYAHKFGWPLPQPKDPLDLLARQFTDAARQEIRYDKKTKRPYRANHAVPTGQKNGNNLFGWVDIDDEHTTTAQMRKSFVNRREQMVDDGLQLSLDWDHWNDNHPEAEPINLPMDFTLDIEWRKASLDDIDDAA